MKTLRTENLLAVFYFAILALSPLACGHGQDVDLEEVCSSICGKFGHCDSDIDSIYGCTQGCMMERGMSMDYLSSMAGCLDILSCERIDNGQLPECVYDRLNQVHSPSSNQRGACETISRTVSVCGGYDEQEILFNCVYYTSAYISENLLVALEGCYFGNCDSIDACVQSVLREYNAEDILDIILGTMGIAGGGSGGGGGGGSGGGGGGGSGGGGTDYTVCDEVLDRMNQSMNELCEGLFDFCCVCICWNHNQVVTHEDEEYCYCGDTPSGQVGLAFNGECEGDVLAWASGVLENGTWEDETADMIVSQCSSGGGGGGGSGECHSTGTLKCSSGYLWALERCDDGTERLSSENFYECPCGCYHGASYCNMC